ncbi:MAG TPA: hypothetical protein VG942_01860 [Hyphomonadaceae bacterium]|nr:hypothetical protein [Hyphomonadaceae bacterium]
MMPGQMSEPRGPAEDLSALLTMTRYISSEVSDLVQRPEHITDLLAAVAAELEAEVRKASRGDGDQLPG